MQISPTRPKTHAFAFAVAAAIIAGLAATAGAVEVRYVGTIRSGLSAPTSLAASTDQIAALQPFSGQVVAFTPDGTVTNRIDIAGDARGLGRLSTSTYVFCDRDLGQATAIDVTTGEQSIFYGGLDNPTDLVVSNGTCHILDAGSLDIISVDDRGSVVAQIGLSAAPGLTVGAATALAWDGAHGTFHVFDQTQSRAHVFDRSGNYVGSYCSFGNEAGTVTRGGGLAADADGYTYIVDRYQGRIAVFDADREFVLDIEAGALTGEPLVVPTGIAVDAQGTIYVASTEDDCIHVFFLDKTAIPDGELAAAPLFPSPAGTVDVNDVRLVASLAAAAGMGTSLSADFQIVDASDPGQVVAEATAIAADEVGVDNQGRTVGTATWRPESALEPGVVYQWRTRARTDMTVGAWSDAVTFSTRPAPLSRELEPNYPNPFNPQTTIAFTLPATDRVTLEIYNLTGTRVWNQVFQNVTAGRHTVEWNGRNDAGEEVASGVYFYRLQTDDFNQTRKMVLIR